MLKDQLLEDLKVAMKEKDTNKKNVIQMVRAAILQVEKDKKIELTEEQIIEIAAKEAKKRKESMVEYEKAGRQDIVKQLEEEMIALNKYLPEQLSEKELTDKIKQIIEQVEAKDMKDMGKVMKLAKEEIGAKADGKTINEIVKKLLG